MFPLYSNTRPLSDLGIQVLTNWAQSSLLGVYTITVAPQTETGGEFGRGEGLVRGTHLVPHVPARMPSNSNVELMSHLLAGIYKAKTASTRIAPRRGNELEQGSRPDQLTVY